MSGASSALYDEAEPTQDRILMPHPPPLDPRYFRRQDESPDPLFYIEARLTVHIDDPALMAVTETYRELMPAGGGILVLMSS